jgi:hypothetical protein
MIAQHAEIPNNHQSIIGLNSVTGCGGALSQPLLLVDFTSGDKVYMSDHVEDNATMG